ncbi:MAG: hypothetical protein GWO11_00885 [Desulfuromonadales bacterium]|nr:hypothetical protein [Desulfuromonadales bacterium]NIR33066.1 hypothetical protein [Desulfuromonadales bacterium]NIS39304.1 hypothetical protein [Desulfuromonadales bacterium]
MLQGRALSVLGLIVLLLFCGCAPTTAQRTEELLLKDYKTMSDAELETYYFRLNDQIARVERRSRDTRVGIGVGSAPVRLGVSTGVRAPQVAEDLRERRNEVRTELSRRGLRP